MGVLSRMDCCNIGSYRLLLFGVFMVLGISGIRAQAEMAPPSISFHDLEQRFRSGNDTLYIINFWATWCKPCVEELPYLEAFHKEHQQEKVKVLLVSLDFQRMVATKLVPFIQDRGLDAEVVHLADTKANEWIDRVNMEWSGAIPATVVRKGDREIFHEGSFPDMKALENFVNQIL